LWLISKCQVISYVYKPYLLKTPNLFNLKIYLYRDEKYLSELPTPIKSIRIVPTEGPREASLIFIGTSDTRSELPMILESFSILPTEGP
jgi:hypothetical protein